MKKYISLFIVILLMTGSIFALGAKDSKTNNKDSLQIVTTIFPEYDWVKNILGNNPANAEITMLLNNGVDLHSYQPTVTDILKISTCDLFIYVGGESDGWVDDALAESTNKNMVVINLLDVLGDSIKEEELVEGMQVSEHHHDHDHEHESEEAEHDHDHDHESEEAEHDHEHDHESEEAEHEHHHDHEEPEYDEHVWLSLRSAAIICQSISNALEKIDAANAAVYKANTASYIAKLNELDSKYTDVVAKAPVKTLLFGDRFPFRYFVDDYGLNYYAAFVGCSAETEASFETIAFLANKVDELSLKAVMTIEGKDHRIAQTIVDNTKEKNQKIITMDSMQSTTQKDVQNGTTYLSVMESNLEAVKEALK
ncbi:MAG: metal ABC transporter substrate-binding protein [Treponemataceae bacterium]|nr:metal ABC transporter substrate-binding protein [Treponemataceae bacterium]